MTRKREFFRHSIESIESPAVLHDCVRRALCLRHARLHAVVAAAGIASVAPLALGAAFPPVVPLASLYPAAGGDGSRGFVLTGMVNEFSGESVSAAGDVNGDGIDDLIIGAENANQYFQAGKSYVVFGSTQAFPAIMPLASLLPSGGGDGSRGFVLSGVDANDEAGISVSVAGDINGDGIDDLIVGAYGGDPSGKIDAGESYVVFGSTQGFPAILPLKILYPAGGGDGSRGFVLTGIGAGDRSGCAVSAAGDVNGDGVDDLIVGARNADPGLNGDEGESYIVFGSTQGFPAVFPLESLKPTGGGDGSHGFVLTGISDIINDDHSGGSVSAAGDINGDGNGDVIVGARLADPGERDDAGESYVVFGSTQAFPPVFPLASLYPDDGGDGSHGFVITGIEPSDQSGVSVSRAGDVNGDGVDDVIIGAEHASPGGVDSGAGYVVFGSTQSFPAIVPLASLYPAHGGDGSRGFVLPGIGEVDVTGRSVSAAGDINADGIDDVIIGAPNSSPGGTLFAGESYVVFGSTQGFPAVFPLARLFEARGGDGSRGFVLTGIDASDGSGSSVSEVGDVNGDGIDDLLIGAPFADSFGNPRPDDRAGESYVVFGRAAAP